VFRSLDDRDKNARSRYETLRNKYLNVTSEDEIDKMTANNVTNYGMTEEQMACLGISRQFICATEFPKCKDNENLQMGMCHYYCALWLNRCPDETETYNTYCVGRDKTSKDSMCTEALSLWPTALVLASLVSVFLV
jgi:hypothetical protein